MSDAGPAGLFDWALLFHEFPPGHARESHWDLLIREGEVLRAWALDRNPLEHEHCRATALPDHRLLYLDWTGTLSGDRGQVTRLARGRIERNWFDGVRFGWDLTFEDVDASTLTLSIQPGKTGEPTMVQARRAGRGGRQSSETNTL